MRNLILLFLLNFVLLNTVLANSYYKLDERNLEAVFSESENIKDPFLQLSLNESRAKLVSSFKPNEDLNKHTIAAIVATASFVLAVGVAIPIHRFILGTGNSGVKIFFAYFCTLSGCGVGLVLDAIFLWINMDNNKFENCERIIMWNEQ